MHSNNYTLGLVNQKNGPFCGGGDLQKRNREKLARERGHLSGDDILGDKHG